MTKTLKRSPREFDGWSDAQLDAELAQAASLLAVESEMLAAAQRRVMRECRLLTLRAQLELVRGTNRFIGATAHMEGRQ